MSARKPIAPSLYEVKPLAAMSDAELAAFHLQAGFHTADDDPTCRCAEQAFFIRQDVPLLDALCTLEQRLRQLSALLGMMIVAPHSSPSAQEAAGACSVLCAEALGLRELVALAVDEAVRLSRLKAS